MTGGCGIQLKFQIFFFRISSKIPLLSCFLIPVAELFGRFLPLRPDREVVHRESWITRHVLLDLEEGGEGLGDLLVLQGGAGLQEDETLASDVARRVVDVQLIVLVLVKERAPGLENGKMIVIPGSEKTCRIVIMIEA